MLRLIFHRAAATDFQIRAQPVPISRSALNAAGSPGNSKNSSIWRSTGVELQSEIALSNTSDKDLPVFEGLSLQMFLPLTREPGKT